ncbi:MAG TPA: pyridoxal phosphate-dependent aminotransferase [Chitinophagaceae bacterium]|nr:pyridoxal phosphate-dependent aminotransferase [Chitinophagaceae bacterium]
MPRISLRGEDMPQSPIRKLNPFANEAKARGVEVFHLNIGQPDIETPPSIMDAVRNFNDPVLEYSPSEGFLSYREALAGYYHKNDIAVTANDIIITTGGSEAISFALKACLNPGDEIIIPEPFYANYNGFAIASGVNVMPITSTIENGFALPPMEAFENAITERTKAIMICNPNNPTGYLYSDEELSVLRDLCIKYDLFLMSDEAYREFCYDGAKHTSVLSLEGLEEHAILLDTISKRYSACGARIGALVTKNKEVYEAVLKFAQARLSPPTLEQVLAEEATRLPDDYFADVLASYQSRRDVLVKRLRAIDGVFCPEPKGAFYVMAALPVESAEHFSEWVLSSFDHEMKTVMMAPGSGFYATKGFGLNEVRMAYVLTEERIHEAMDCLEAALKAYAAR